ncbi:uncharacterized protein MONBRDRAFT_23301 [Monosiga brevicollis MX1]|uniref:dolichyl-phosphate-mannose--protein mannosyltransferase n=1 Tax=Monosiga brevicollis TaxID=81824 RepID=A9UT00_MONBE|nr:uncharacterized protein MONBRDRAFT_23301 [Monosiga brevicollis MX1]EDQ91409.1 predicted protein [Monosiga brevicollis MX1]|eukprot:XP_001743831.1 hypothetical protein [Monosiga brevicollis MX1]
MTRRSVPLAAVRRRPRQVSATDQASEARETDRQTHNQTQSGTTTFVATPRTRYSFVPVYLLVAAAAIAVHLPSLQGDFVFDDARGVVANPDVRLDTSWSDLWAHDFWGTPMTAARSHKSYRPLTVATFKLNNLLAGMAPAGFHWGNVLLHTVASLMMARLAWHLFDRDRLPAAVTALLFAVHPIHTEAVCNIVGRAEILAGILYLTALLVVLNKTWSWPLQVLCVALCAICSMLAKEQGITALGTAAALAICLQANWTTEGSPLGLLLKSMLQQRVRNLVVSLAAIGVLSLLVRVQLNAQQAPIFNANEVPAAFATGFTKWATMNYYIVVNLQLLVLPLNLCHDWSHETIPLLESPLDPRFGALMLVYGVAIVGVLWLLLRPWSAISCNQEQQLQKRRLHMVTLLGLAALVLPFLPASNLFFPVGFVIAERVLYLPSIGLCLLAGVAARWLSTRLGPRGILLLASLVFLAMAAQSVQRSFDWQTDYSLHLAGHRTHPANSKIAINLGQLMSQAAQQETNVTRRAELLDEAERLFRDRLSASASDASAHLNLGTLLQNRGQYEEALQVLTQGLEKKDSTRTSLRIVTAIATLYYQQQDYAQAKPYFELAMQVGLGKVFSSRRASTTR